MKEFCASCGQEKQVKNDTLYDTRTGKLRTYLACTNIKCRSGCENNGGHKIERRGFFIWTTEQCSRCGHVPY